MIAESDNPYAAWVGREEQRSARIDESTVQAMSATLDMESSPVVGDSLSPGWQWLFFNPAVRRSELGVDGHPAKGGFLPPVELPRRMWAGSRIRYLAPLSIGSNATRKSKILSVVNKTGKRGALCFVTVEHTTQCDEKVCIVEQQDIVYKEATPPGTALPTPPRHEVEAQWSQNFTPDTTLLFRYSALTFNGHRIHYDLPYARDEEGYPALVVQGPLNATLLQKFALEHGGGKRLSEFNFKGVNPLFVGRDFQLEGSPGDEPGIMNLWVRGPEGELGMSATARFTD